MERGIWSGAATTNQSRDDEVRRRRSVRTKPTDICQRRIVRGGVAKRYERTKWMRASNEAHNLKETEETKVKKPIYKSVELER